MERNIIGKNHNSIGVAPAIILINPKYQRNVSMIKRIASCYGIKQIWYTGNRVSLEPEKGKRLPREERMRGYKDVELINFDYPLEQFDNVVPIGVEILPGAQPLFDYEHPENAVYLFGPEDGEINQTWRRHCHDFVFIPTKHCLNLATTVSAVMYDRACKLYKMGSITTTELYQILEEDRGFMESET